MKVKCEYHETWTRNISSFKKARVTFPLNDQKQFSFLPSYTHIVSTNGITRTEIYDYFVF